MNNDTVVQENLYSVTRRILYNKINTLRLCMHDIFYIIYSNVLFFTQKFIKYILTIMFNNVINLVNILT